MPKIPQYSPQVQTAKAAVQYENLDRRGAYGEAVTQGLGQVSDMLGKIGEDIQRQAQKTELDSVESAYTKYSYAVNELEQKAFGLKGDNALNGKGAIYEEKHKVRQKILEELPPHLRDAASTKFLDRDRVMLTNVEGHSRKELDMMREENTKTLMNDAAKEAVAVATNKVFSPEGRLAFSDRAIENEKRAYLAHASQAGVPSVVQEAKVKEIDSARRLEVAQAIADSGDTKAAREYLSTHQSLGAMADVVLDKIDTYEAQGAAQMAVSSVSSKLGKVDLVKLKQETLKYEQEHKGSPKAVASFKAAVIKYTKEQDEIREGYADQFHDTLYQAVLASKGSFTSPEQLPSGAWKALVNTRTAGSKSSDSILAMLATNKRALLDDRASRQQQGQANTLANNELLKLEYEARRTLTPEAAGTLVRASGGDSLTVSNAEAAQRKFLESEKDKKQGMSIKEQHDKQIGFATRLGYDPTDKETMGKVRLAFTVAATKLGYDTTDMTPQQYAAVEAALSVPVEKTFGADTTVLQENLDSLDDLSAAVSENNKKLVDNPAEISEDEFVAQTGALGVPAAMARRAYNSKTNPVRDPARAKVLYELHLKKLSSKGS